MSRPPNPPVAPEPAAPKRYCQTCRYYTPAVINTDVGKLTVRTCSHRSGPYFMTVPGAHGSCDLYHGGPLEGKL